MPAAPLVDVDARNAKGNTALIWAARMKQGTSVRLLLRWGADKDAAEEHGCTPLRIAAQNLADPECLAFLRECLHQIVVIMLDQTPSKIGHFERQCVELALKHATPVIAALLEAGEGHALDTLVQLFNRKRAFYKGVKTYWSTLPGAPEVRAALQMDEPGRGDGSAERAREAGPRRQRRQDAPAPTEEEKEEEEEEKKEKEEEEEEEERRRASRRR